MHRLGVLLFVGCMLAPLSAAAQSQADSNACMGDAFRLCASAIPDRTRVRQCLHDNKRKLSAACFAVINRSRATTTARAPAVR